MARGRRGGKKNIDKLKATAKKVKDKKAASNKDTYKTQPFKDPKRNDAERLTGGNTSREKGLTKSKFGNQSGYSIEREKISDLQQSIGSLNRRIDTALTKGDDVTAKDLRSRLNKFTSDLGYAKAIQAGGVARDSSGNIMRTSSGNPMMVTSGRDIFDETKQEDFGDPTRRLQNMYPDRYRKMYPNILATMGAGINDYILNGTILGKVLGGFNKGKDKFKESDLGKMTKDLGTIGGQVINKVTGLPVIKESIETGKNLATMGGRVVDAAAGMIPEDLRNMPGGIKNALMQNVNFPELNLKSIFQPNPIPYQNPILPGQRYPLDPTFGTYDNKSFADRDVDVFGEVDENILGQSSNNTTGQQFDFQPGDSLYSPENYQNSNATVNRDTGQQFDFQPGDNLKINEMMERLAPRNTQDQTPNQKFDFQPGNSLYSPDLNQNQSPNLNPYFSSPEEAINFQDNMIDPNNLSFNFDSTGLELPPLNQEAIDILNSNATGYNQGGEVSPVRLNEGGPPNVTEILQSAGMVFFVKGDDVIPTMMGKSIMIDENNPRPIDIEYGNGKQVKSLIDDGYEIAVVDDSAESKKIQKIVSDSDSMKGKSFQNLDIDEPDGIGRKLFNGVKSLGGKIGKAFPALGALDIFDAKNQYDQIMDGTHPVISELPSANQYIGSGEPAPQEYNQGGIASINTDPYYDQLKQTNSFMGGF